MHSAERRMKGECERKRRGDRRSRLRNARQLVREEEDQEVEKEEEEEKKEEEDGRRSKKVE